MEGAIFPHPVSEERLGTCVKLCIATVTCALVKLHNDGFILHFLINTHRKAVLTTQKL
jgi:hypothetical protein